jgi:hypothetical protein
MYKQLVLAIFPSETAADEAAAGLKKWEKANDEIKKGAIGVLVKDNTGKIKAHAENAAHDNAAPSFNNRGSSYSPVSEYGQELTIFIL